MTYGLKVEGTDGGGSFLVTDTNLNLINLQVVESGTGHSFTLDSPLGPTDLLFVKNPQPVGGSYDTHIESYQGTTGQAFAYFYAPEWFFCNIHPVTNVVQFWGGSFRTVFTNTIQGTQTLVYRGWEVEMDYFVVRDVGKIFADGQNRNDDYGLQILTANGDTAFDSRAVITNKTFNINAVTNTTASWAPQSSTEYFPFGVHGSYCNIEWTSLLQMVHDPDLALLWLRAVSINNIGAYIYDGEFQFDDGGQDVIFYRPGFAMFSATLHTGGSSGGGASSGDTSNSGDDGSGGISASLEFANGATFMQEGVGGNGSITVNAVVSESGNYNFKIIRNDGEAGSTGEFLTATGKYFQAATGSFTFTALNDSVAETGWQGENFTVELRTGLTLGSGDLLASIDFTLYDEDSGTNLVGTTTGSQYNIYSDDTSAAVQFYYASQGSGSVDARIRYGSTTVKSFTLPQDVNTTVQVDSQLPSAGNSRQYTLQIYNGRTYVDAKVFTIYRDTSAGPLQGTTPTSNPSIQNATNGVIQLPADVGDLTLEYSGLTVGEEMRVLDTTNSNDVVLNATQITSSTQFFNLNSVPAPGNQEVLVPQVRRNGGGWVSKAGGTVTVNRAQNTEDDTGNGGINTGNDNNSGFPGGAAN